MMNGYDTDNEPQACADPDAHYLHERRRARRRAVLAAIRAAEYHNELAIPETEQGGLT